MDAPVAESRLPVGSSASTTGGGRRSPGRSRPAAVPRPTAGSAGRRPGARARPGPARQRPAAAARCGGPRRTAARRPRCRARSGARRGRTAGTRTRSGTPAAPASSRSVIRGRVQAGDAHGPGGRLVQGAHQVQQRGLARPRRADDRGQLPGGHRQAHLVQRPHRRRPGYTFDTCSSSSTGAAPGRSRTGAALPPAVMSPAPRRAARGSAPRSPAPARKRRRRSRSSPAHSAACSPGRRPPRRTRPDAWASSALTGTTSAFRARRGGDVHRHRRLVQGPRRRGSVSVTCTGIVVVCVRPDPDGWSPPCPPRRPRPAWWSRPAA